MTYLYEQMILVPPHILIVRCIALWVKSTSHRARREEWRFYVHMYNIHQSSWMCSSQQEGGVCSQTKFSSHPQKKGQVQRSASFWNCVIYAWHTLNMILLTIIRKIPLLLLFYSPKFLEALLGIVLRNLLVLLFHTWFPQKMIRNET